MNPATDIGKRNLSSNIRNRFTEIYVDDVDDTNDLELIIRNYLLPLTHVTADLIKSIAAFYLKLKEKDESIMKNLSNSEGRSAWSIELTISNGQAQTSVINVCCYRFPTQLQLENPLSSFAIRLLQLLQQLGHLHL